MLELHHVPLTKTLIAATLGASLLAQASSRQGRRLGSSSLVQVASSALVLSNPQSLVLGVVLLWSCARLAERHLGSAKFAAFSFICTTFGYVLQRGLTEAGSRWLVQSSFPTGPWAFMFASLAYWAVTVPACTKFQVCGVRFTDKTFIYLAGLQLLRSQGWSSLLAGGAGLVAGLLYTSNALGVRNIRAPRFLCRLASKLLGPLLEPPAIPGVGQASQQRPGAGHGNPGQVQAPAMRAPPAPSPAALEQLMAMGFSEGQAAPALVATGNDVQAAIALLV
mmetsp:Transcript_8456/g.14505  ORF Transcript_8456/g.14505 Transcript_8456/m.14505 type:complete len:279 (+) Transcript_8456:150-986(+)